MSSPRWADAQGRPMLAACISAATIEAWQAATADRLTVFRDSLRRMVGAEIFDAIEFTAYHVFQLQPEPPQGFDTVPEWALFRMCGGCGKVQRTKHTAPQNGRVKLQVLRDPNWLARQFEAGRSCAVIAEKLECSPANVTRWAEVHGLVPPHTLRTEEIELGVRRMHAEREAPGKIAAALRTTPAKVREVLARLGLATKKRGQVYHDREWWRVRLEDRGCTKLDCAREAGIQPHAATYWTTHFGFSHLMAANAKTGRRKKYPELYSATALRALLARNGDSYEAAARDVGAAASLVSAQARKLLGWAKRHENQLPHSSREWWVERLDRGATTYEMGEEAGVEEKTARERLRVFGLLDRGYANNAARERALRSNRSTPAPAPAGEAAA